MVTTVLVVLMILALLEIVLLNGARLFFMIVSTQSALADADALNLDQDYRLTLLELGVTDDETTA